MNAMRAVEIVALAISPTPYEPRLGDWELLAAEDALKALFNQGYVLVDPPDKPQACNPPPVERSGDEIDPLRLQVPETGVRGSNRAERHTQHYRSCGCLDHGAVCCNPKCCAPFPPPPPTKTTAEVLGELRARLETADQTLTDLSYQTPGTSHLVSKRAGVRLALDYLREYEPPPKPTPVDPGRVWKR